MTMELTTKEHIQLVMLNESVKDMQGHTFFCQDDEGVLRRWTPPRPVKLLQGDDT